MQRRGSAETGARLRYLEHYGFAHHGVGGAHELDPSTAHKSAVPDGSLVWHLNRTVDPQTDAGAFATASFDKTGLNFDHYDHTGAHLFKAPAVASRLAGRA